VLARGRQRDGKDENIAQFPVCYAAHAEA